MLAAVTARAFDMAAELAPAGVEVLRLPDGRDDAEFVLPDWMDRETIVREADRPNACHVAPTGLSGPRRRDNLLQAASRPP